MERFECNCAIDLWLESRGVVKLTTPRDSSHNLIVFN